MTDGSRLRIDSVDGDLTVAGEIDAHTCGDLDAALAEVGGGDVRVDLTGVTFIDSSGLRVFVEHHHRLADEGSSLRIVRPSRPVQRLFEIAGLDAQFNIDPD
jgi:anti-sigma B factor antagonist